VNITQARDNSRDFNWRIWRTKTMPTQPVRGLARREALKALLLAPPAVALAACVARPASAPASTTIAATEPPIQTVQTVQPEQTAAQATPETAPTEIPTLAPAETPIAQPTPTLEVQAQVLPPTPACGDDDEPTPQQTEGPYYTPNTPERNSFLEPGVTGTRMIVQGFVLNTSCQPVARAMLDFWHADDAGVYDNAGYKLRGHFFTDEAGRYELETIRPGIYTGRTRHFHVKVQAPNQPVLTTQLYFPDEPANARDGIFRPELVLNMTDTPDGSKAGGFNFVLNVA
jgi:protocatechuate 3,4-dioxygenase beta subunit